MILEQSERGVWFYSYLDFWYYCTINSASRSALRKRSLGDTCEHHEASFQNFLHNLRILGPNWGIVHLPIPRSNRAGLLFEIRVSFFKNPNDDIDLTNLLAVKEAKKQDYFYDASVLDFCCVCKRSPPRPWRCHGPGRLSLLDVLGSSHGKEPGWYEWPRLCWRHSQGGPTRCRRSHDSHHRIHGGTANHGRS